MRTEQEIKDRMIELNLQSNRLAVQGHDIDAHKKCRHFVEVLKWVLEDDKKTH